PCDRDDAALQAVILQSVRPLLFITTHALRPQRDTNSDEMRDAQRRAVTSTPVGRLQGLGVDLGVHSRAYRNLSGLTEDELHEEVHGAVVDALAVGIKRPRACSYPYGAWSETAARALAGAGVRVAFVGEDHAEVQQPDPLRTPRIVVGPEETPAQLLG